MNRVTKVLHMAVALNNLDRLRACRQGLQPCDSAGSLVSDIRLRAQQGSFELYEIQTSEQELQQFAVNSCSNSSQSIQTQSVHSNHTVRPNYLSQPVQPTVPLDPVTLSDPLNNNVVIEKRTTTTTTTTTVVEE